MTKSPRSLLHNADQISLSQAALLRHNKPQHKTQPLSWLRSHPLTVCSNHRFHHPLPPAADTNATVPVLTITPLGDDVPVTTTRPTPKTLSTSQTAARAATTSSASTSTTSRTGCRATTRRRGFSSPTGSRALGASEPPASPSTTTGSFWTACSCGGSLAGPSVSFVLLLVLLCARLVFSSLSSVISFEFERSRWKC